MIGNKIKELREETGLSRKDLADQLNVSYYTIAKYEENKRKPDIETLSKLADIFNVSTDYLLDRTLESKKEYIIIILSI